MPNQVYRLDPNTASLRVVADGFLRPNGIAFAGDGKIVYMWIILVLPFSFKTLTEASTDTGAAGGFLGNNETYPATM
jgi:gluconolactonase